VGGPIIHEYYGATEGLGFAACDSAQCAGSSRTARQGSARRTHVRRTTAALPKETQGTLWFKAADAVRYFNERRRQGRDRRTGSRSTVGDVGDVDAEDFLI